MGPRRQTPHPLWAPGHPTDAAQDGQGVVVQNEQVARGLWHLRLELLLPWGPPRPGQFVQLQCPGDSCWRPRRPFSIAGWTQGKAGNGRMDIVYAPIGTETRRMTFLRENDPLDVLGPLGVGFEVVAERRAVPVGGGRGIAPLLFLAEKLTEHQHPVLLLYGYRSLDLRFPMESTCPVREASEDGRRELKGTVVDLLENLLSSGQLDPEGDALYACGPTPMLAALARWAGEKGFPLQTSLETYFGCGYGVCAGCAVPMRGASGYGVYAFACREGPVFNAEEVDWNGLRD